MLNKKTKWEYLGKNKFYLLAILCGGLLVFSFPVATFSKEWLQDGFTSFLPWICIAPMFFIIEKKSLKKTFLTAYAFGLVYFIGTLFWIVVAMNGYGYIPFGTSILLLILLCLYLAVYPGLFFLSTRFFSFKYKIPLSIVAPVSWVSLELLRRYFFFMSFPWSELGYSQYLNHNLMQITSYTGVYGIDFLIILSNVVLYKSIKSYKEHKNNVIGILLIKKLPMLEILIFSLLFSFVWIYGKVLISKHEIKSPQKNKIAILQGNIPQDEKWLISNLYNIVDIYREMTFKANAQGADLIIWPEASAPMIHPEQIEYLPPYLKINKPIQANILIGTVNRKKVEGKEKYFNSAYYFNNHLNLISKYHKTHLVPFGEYVPLEKYIPFKKLISQSGNFYTDNKFTVMPLKDSKFGVMICYEAIFPDIARKFILNGANFLVNITNDAWFDKTSALYQHLAMSTVRAAEYGVPIVRVANTGISASIDRFGRIKTRTLDFVQDMKLIEVETDLQYKKTFYAIFGDLFAYLNVFALLIFLIFYLKKRKNT
ncbi:MAG: apolipoprotein N-acyltransferase [Pseudomonadota bacterium]